ncbi:MAG: hypothetical protein J6R67_02955 [Treponema sp.]|nr:hypothetical protein [Treponema sp.]
MQKKYELTINGSSIYDSDSLNPLAVLLGERLNTPTSAHLKDTTTGEVLALMEEGNITYLAPSVTVSFLRDLCTEDAEYGKMLVCQGLVAFEGNDSPTAKAMYDALMKLHVELFGPVDMVDLTVASLALLFGGL